VALDPAGLARLVQGIRAVEQAMTAHQRLEIEPEEERFKQALLYRLVLVRRKRPGERFAEHDFDYRRHATGVDCRDAAFVMHRFTPARELAAGALLHWNDLTAG
jgi:sialic acid synthase SpsE